MSRRLRYLFADFDSFFASVEQLLQPRLQGRPVGIAPVDADTTTLIAASREAKPFGIRCGTPVPEARRRCPGIEIVVPNHRPYAEYGERAREILQQVLPIDRDLSVDEMTFRLLGTEASPAVARELANEMKSRLLREFGPCLTASIGVAPNVPLAKLAGEMRKPDGFAMIQSHELPVALHGVPLVAFAGINRRTAARLGAHGIYTTEQMCAATVEELRAAFGSIHGERWWHTLRGDDLEVPTRARQSLGHSHVLPPELRTAKQAYAVLRRLCEKATARLRKEGLCAGTVAFAVRGRERSWEHRRRFETPTRDNLRVGEALREAWPDADFRLPFAVAVSFTDLLAPDAVTPSLFDPTGGKRAALDAATDRIARRFGRHAVHIGSIHEVQDTAEEKIAFGKMDLFDLG